MLHMGRLCPWLLILACLEWVQVVFWHSEVVWGRAQFLGRLLPL
jgi:hypothetical protein